LQGRTGGRSVVYSGQLYFSLGACVAHLCLWLCGDGSRSGVQRSGAEPRVESCWSSSGDVESSMLLLPHTRTHLRTQKQKKKFAPITRTVGVTRRFVTTVRKKCMCI
jgi:hypothetical protein